MTLEEIKAVVLKMPREDQSRLLGFACYLNMTPEERSENRNDLNEALLHNDFERWESATEIRRRLGDLEDAESRRRVQVMAA